MLTTLTRPLVRAVERFLPGSLFFAIALTVVVAALALGLTDAGPLQIVTEWGDGLTGLLEFMTQMCLVLLLGHTLAHTRPVRKALDRLAAVPRSAPMAYVFVAVCTSLAALISWGLGLVVAALLSIEVARVARERGLRVHYPLLVAAGYSGFAVWHMGYSGSAPLTAATPGSFVERQIGFTIPGAFANFIAVDEKFCWKIDAIAERFGSEEMAYAVGALTEPSCVAYNAMFTRAGGFKPGHYVNVFGAGPIGLAAIGLAKAAGAGMIAAFEISPQRRELAKAVGADFVYDPREVVTSEVLNELSRGEGFDFHFEAAGVPEIAIPEMEKALAINAKIVQVGRAAQRVPMYLESFQVRRSQAFGAQGHSGHENFPNVIRLVASGRLDLSPIITAHYNLEDTVKAIAKSTQRTDGKIMVHPN